jgi:drug/metabolite transporter (DMT)-like permease
MIFLLFAIICSAAIPVLFKAFGRWNLNIQLVVPANYLACAVCGALFSGQLYWHTPQAGGLMLALTVVQGGLLAGNLFLLAHVSQTVSVALAAFASRVSVAIPTAAAFFLFNDQLTGMKGLGIGLAVVALYLVTVSTGPTVSAVSNTAQTQASRSRALLVIVFFTFGLHFLFFKYVQQTYLTAETHHLYLGQSFLCAFFLSLAALFFAPTQTESRKEQPRAKSIGWGMLLGLSNYIAVYLFMRALSMPGWESSAVFPAFSFGVVLLSSVAAAILFVERLSRVQLIGLAVGLVSVVLLNQ